MIQYMNMVLQFRWDIMVVLVLRTSFSTMFDDDVVYIYWPKIGFIFSGNHASNRTSKCVSVAALLFCPLSNGALSLTNVANSRARLSRPSQSKATTQHSARDRHRVSQTGKNATHANTIPAQGDYTWRDKSALNAVCNGSLLTVLYRIPPPSGFLMLLVFKPCMRVLPKDIQAFRAY